ncbi:MAG: beta-lactamase family protein [Proteobacteria bacterium]|nr:beta-lactamase family protein [Pseudomonadota bacterium]
MAKPIDVDELRSFVDGVVTDAMERDVIAGVSVAIVDRSGVLFSKGYGVASLSPARAMDSDTLSRVGSISKTIVWIALMQLAEQGKLSLDDPVNQHLPPPLQIPDEGFTEPIRIRHLMTHSAGFEQTILGHMEVEDVNRELPLETYLARYRPHRVLPPGQLAVYSNYSAALAGVIVAHTSGMSWEDYAETKVLRPLGMPTATFREAIPADIARQRGLPQPASPVAAAVMSKGFHWQEGHLEEAVPEIITHYAPAGALFASANGIASYMSKLLDPEGLVRAGVLNAQSAHTLLEPSFSNAKGFGAIYHGYFQFPFPGSNLAFGHDGSTRYQHAVMLIVPDVGIGLFIAVNTPSGLPLVERFPNLLGLHLLGQNAPAMAVPDAGTHANSEAAALAGTYRPIRRAFFRTERALLNLLAPSVEAAANGDLLVSGLSNDVMRYRPIGHHVYQELTGLGRIAFQQSGHRLMLLDPTGSNPLERISFWEGPTWFLLIFALTHLAAVWGSIRFVRQGRAAFASRITGGWGILSLAWLVALVLTWVAIAPWLSDTEVLIMQYPGKLFPLACWLFLICAIGTLILIVALAVVRPRGWAALRWIGVCAGLLTFGCCTVTFHYWGLLGFWGW